MDVPESLKQALEKRQQQKQGLDPVSEAAMDVVALEQQREERAIQQLEEKDRMIAECYQFVGRIQAFNLVEKVITVSVLVQLKQMKESKVYRAMPGVETWENFCKTVGYTPQYVNEQLQNLATFGEEFLKTVFTFQISQRDIRRLRRLNSDGTLQVTDTEVVIGDERIPWSADNKEEIQEALERLIEAKDQVILEKEATIRANTKVIESKQELIKRQEKDLAKYEKEAEAKGPEAFEQEFIQNMVNARTTIEGWLNQFDPRLKPLPENYTPRMANEMMITLQALLRSVKASYDTAAEVYGDPDLDGPGWVPPHLRQSGE